MILQYSTAQHNKYAARYDTISNTHVHTAVAPVRYLALAATYASKHRDHCTKRGEERQLAMQNTVPVPTTDRKVAWLAAKKTRPKPLRPATIQHIPHLARSRPQTWPPAAFYEDHQCPVHWPDHWSQPWLDSWCFPLPAPHPLPLPLARSWPSSLGSEPPAWPRSACHSHRRAARDSPAR